MTAADVYRNLRPLQIISTKPKTNRIISVLTYNLLAQHHIWNDIYPYCKSGVLKWPHRRSNLMTELRAYGFADFMAFQECSKWQEFWSKEFGEMGTFFAEKQDGKDGLAIVYNKERFKEVHRESLSFAPLMGQLEATPNIAQLLVVQEAEQYFLITNTHLFWRPEFDSLRALQAHRLRKRIDALIAELKLPSQKTMIIMCGDWNSDPKSLTYRLLTGVNITDLEWKEVVDNHAKCMPVLGDNESSLENATRLFTQVKADFLTIKPLRSAYAQLRDRKDPSKVGEPAHTSINSYVDCLDYIFHDSGEVESLLMLPPDEILFAQTALPNEVYSSDHVSLLAHLRY